MAGKRRRGVSCLFQHHLVPVARFIKSSFENTIKTAQSFNVKLPPRDTAPPSRWLMDSSDITVAQVSDLGNGVWHLIFLNAGFVDIRIYSSNDPHISFSCRVNVIP